MKILSLEIKGKEYKAYITPDGYGRMSICFLKLCQRNIGGLLKNNI